jgi:hypothetical protein
MYIPKDMVLEVAEFLDDREVTNLFSTCKSHRLYDYYEFKDYYNIIDVLYRNNLNRINVKKIYTLYDNTKLTNIINPSHLKIQCLHLKDIMVGSHKMWNYFPQSVTHLKLCNYKPKDFMIQINNANVTHLTLKSCEGMQLPPYIFETPLTTIKYHKMNIYIPYFIMYTNITKMIIDDCGINVVSRSSYPMNIKTLVIKNLNILEPIKFENMTTLETLVIRNVVWFENSCCSLNNLPPSLKVLVKEDWRHCKFDLKTLDPSVKVIEANKKENEACCVM